MEEAATPAPVNLVLFDLDVTVPNTESLIYEVSKPVVERHGGELTPEALKAGLGKWPSEAWQAVVDVLQLKGVTAQQLLDETEPLVKDRWREMRLMPGAMRLLGHLHEHGIRMALPNSMPRPSLHDKLSGSGTSRLQEVCDSVTCGDEVEDGKPASDCFRVAAEQAGIPVAQCLAIEDAPAGVAAATAAGLRVVFVPALADKAAYPEPDPGASSGCVAVLPSLYDFKPEQFGLPPFEDEIAGTVPLDPAWPLKGTVVKGFGRGSKELGIPTANLDADSLRACGLAEAVTGIYCGWAGVGESSDVYMMVMSIGWNPFYDNKEKTAEPWILHDFDRDFYGDEIRLLVCAYIRPEANFSSLEALVARIHQDADVTREALRDPRLLRLRADPFLQPGGLAGTGGGLEQGRKDARGRDRQAPLHEVGKHAPAKLA